MINEISLMEAYLIETLRLTPLSDELILEKVSTKQAEQLKKLTESNSDFEALYEIEENLTDILQNGYRVKFLTFPGLKRLLELKLNKKEDIDYKVNEFTIENLSLSASEKSELEMFLSKNWRVEQTDNYYKVSPNQ